MILYVFQNKLNGHFEDYGLTWYGHKNGQKIHMIRVYGKYGSPVKKKIKNIYLMKVMAKIYFTPDIGYH